MKDDLPKYSSNKDLIKSLKVHRFCSRRMPLKVGLIVMFKGTNFLINSHTTEIWCSCCHCASLPTLVHAATFQKCANLWFSYVFFKYTRYQNELGQEKQCILKLKSDWQILAPTRTLGKDRLSANLSYLPF